MPSTFADGALQERSKNDEPFPLAVERQLLLTASRLKILGAPLAAGLQVNRFETKFPESFLYGSFLKLT